MLQSFSYQRLFLPPESSKCMIAMYITRTQIFRLLPLFLKKQYSNEMIFMANESKYSTVIPVYTQLCEYSDYCRVKLDDFSLLFSRCSVSHCAASSQLFLPTFA